MPGSGIHSRKPTVFPAGLPQELDRQLSRLEEVFTVSTGTLKEISEHFGQALEAGELRIHYSEAVETKLHCVRFEGRRGYCKPAKSSQ
jgi:hypothetical protein